MMKRIFYFNITYGCNSKCMFCYSHNTHHDSVTHNEISAQCFFEYLEDHHLSSHDRVIINGGEPFLHSEIESILSGLMKYGCEVLIYTNGRLLTKFDLSVLSSKFRFVIPIHGYREVHDRITGAIGSYQETADGLAMLVKDTNCRVDIKIIINKYMISEDKSGVKLLESLKLLRFNNAIHITKMADTIISIKNQCETVSNAEAAFYTKILYEYYKDQNKIVKLFDTCIDGCGIDKYDSFEKYNDSIEVYFKDKNQFREMNLITNSIECMKSCELSDKCKSAVNEYKVLECFDGKIYENLE